MNKDILISVIVPVYNIEKWLPRCVESIRKQTYENLEILLVDDGSTDDTGALCDRMALEDSRIRVFHKKNGGSSSARNLGLREAKGDYIGFVDSDDWLEPVMYEELLEAALKDGADIVQASRDEIDEDGKKRPDVCTPPKEKLFCDSKNFFRELLLHRGDCSFCTKLIKRELFANRQFPEGKLNEDFFLLLQMLPEVSGITILPGQYYHVFYRIGSNTRKKDKNDFSRVFEDIVVNADFAEQMAKEHFPGLSQEAVRFSLFQRLDYLLHVPISRMNKENELYESIRKYLKAHRKDILSNQYLTKKNKIYLFLFSLMPKKLRQIHGLTMKIRGLDT